MKRAVQSWVASMTVAVLCCASTGLAQPKPFTGPVEMYAEQVGLQDLPAPGMPFVVKVKLSNTRETERRLRAFVVRDGRITDVPPLKSYLDEYDMPTYEIQLHAPFAELSYQFVLYNPDGTFTSTPRFSVRRPCIPFVDPNTIKLESKNQGEARLESLVRLARSLESEVASYDVANKLVEELSEKFKEQ